MGFDGAQAHGAPMANGASSSSNKRKRKQTTVTLDKDSSDDLVFLGEIKKGSNAVEDQPKKGGYAIEDAPKKKQRKPKVPKEETEKRLRPYRKKAPQSYLQIHERAISQRMYVIDRTRGGTAEIPEENVDIAGTTGNIYTVCIKLVPECNCPHAKKGNQCKHIVYVLVKVLKVTEPLAYQLAFVSSELREIFEKAPAIPADDTASCDNSDGKRKPIEDDCPICCMEFEADKEEIVYCKAACGNNIHKHCFEQWATAKQGSRGGVTCPFCRTAWVGDDDSIKKVAKNSKVNEEGYVNVAGELGLSGERDYSTYHHYWVQRQARYRRI